MKSHQPSQMTVLTMREKTQRAVAPMIIPPDGGWGWVIVMTGFMASSIMDGISYCFFLYRDPMVHDLEIDPSDISFLSALFTGFYFIGGKNSSFNVGLMFSLVLSSSLKLNKQNSISKCSLFNARIKISCITTSQLSCFSEVEITSAKINSIFHTSSVIS